jgi:uncharacterized membrane protein
MADAMARPANRPISISRHPIYSILLPVPVVCFIGALIADVAYLRSDGNLIWLAFGFIAAIVLLIDFIRSPAVRNRSGWLHLLLFYAALLVELFGVFIHERDGWTAVAGPGITLSTIGVVLILIAGWLHRPVMEAMR